MCDSEFVVHFLSGASFFSPFNGLKISKLVLTCGKLCQVVYMSAFLARSYPPQCDDPFHEFGLGILQSDERQLEEPVTVFLLCSRKPSLIHVTCYNISYYNPITCPR